MIVDDDGSDDDDDDLKIYAAWFPATLGDVYVLWKEEGIKIGVQSHSRNHQLIFWQKWMKCLSCYQEKK